MSKTIGVMGCGWLGMPLAVSLLNEGHSVHGTTTAKEKIPLLRAKGIIPFQISLFEDRIIGEPANFLDGIQVLVLNIPPKLRGGNSENYIEKIRLIQEEIRKSTVTNVIFISSTSVYGDADGEVTEKTPPLPTTASGKQLLAVEKALKEDLNFQTTIIRFGGLIGYDRHPINMLAGRTQLANGYAPVNLIHLDDCIRIISAVLQNSWWNETINGVYPYHPTKKEYYTREAKTRALQIPDYKENSTKKGKKIVSEVLLNVKNYIFTTTP